jgi:hypothetical protein
MLQVLLQIYLRNGTVSKLEVHTRLLFISLAVSRFMSFYLNHAHSIYQLAIKVPNKVLQTSPPLATGDTKPGGAVESEV